MEHTCYDCHVRTVRNLSDKYNLSEKEADFFESDAKKILSAYSSFSHPVLATLLQRLARKYCGNHDLYIHEKKHANSLLLNDYNQWKEMIDKEADPRLPAAKLAVVGNIIDYGAHSVAKDIRSQIQYLYEKPMAIDDRELLFEKVEAAETVLYLGDNTGEIVFDRLFLETLKHKNVTFAVRGKPILNDATSDDALAVGIDSYANILSNGFDAPSTVLEFCSPEFQEAFHSADVIISKGQGNYEGLYDSEKQNIFFMLITKCWAIAEIIGCNVGDQVVLSSSAR